MPFDAIFLSAVTQELQQPLQGAKVDKIYQPERDTLVLQLRGSQGAKRLLLTANPAHPRLQLTALSLENPAQPPMFCMLLRKHLGGGRLRSITQQPMERAVCLTFDCTDEMGVPAEKRLYAELMGRTSNLILCDGAGRIIDCLRRVDILMSERRQVLPGLFYHTPPGQDKRDPLPLARDDWAAALQAAQDTPLQKWLLAHFRGLSPLICREIAFALTGSTEASAQALPPDAPERLAALFASVRQGEFQPTMLRQPDGKPADFSWRPIGQYGAARQQVAYETCWKLLDDFYGERDRRELMQQKSQALRKTVSNLHSRVVRKLALQEKELAASTDRERTRQLGDIVTANLWQMQRGQVRLTATDFYDPEMRQIDIPLSPKLSPQQNAAKFYKDYAKAKTAQRVLTEQIAQGRAEEDYLASVLETIARAECERDLAEIRTELELGGYLRRSGKRSQPKTVPAKPMEFCSSDGFYIYVGRNNRQNDQLTLKLAYKSDLWLHTQKIHGSHVIISCHGQTPPDRTVTEAMMLAAYYSQAREGQGVPVDYTPVRFVKKPGGAKPGMVVYTTYRTGYVTPDAQLVERLRAK